LITLFFFEKLSFSPARCRAITQGLKWC